MSEGDKKPEDKPQQQAVPTLFGSGVPSGPFGSAPSTGLFGSASSGGAPFSSGASTFSGFAFAPKPADTTTAASNPATTTNPFSTASAQSQPVTSPPKATGFGPNTGTSFIKPSTIFGGQTQTDQKPLFSFTSAPLTGAKQDATKLTTEVPKQVAPPSLTVNSSAGSNQSADAEKTPLLSFGGPPASGSLLGKASNVSSVTQSAQTQKEDSSSKMAEDQKSDEGTPVLRSEGSFVKTTSPINVNTPATSNQPGPILGGSTVFAGQATAQVKPAFGGFGGQTTQAQPAFSSFGTPATSGTQVFGSKPAEQLAKPEDKTETKPTSLLGQSQPSTIPATNPPVEQPKPPVFGFAATTNTQAEQPKPLFNFNSNTSATTSQFPAFGQQPPVLAQQPPAEKKEEEKTPLGFGPGSKSANPTISPMSNQPPPATAPAPATSTNMFGSSAIQSKPEQQPAPQGSLFMMPPKPQVPEVKTEQKQTTPSILIPQGKPEEKKDITTTSAPLFGQTNETKTSLTFGKNEAPKEPVKQPLSFGSGSATPVTTTAQQATVNIFGSQVQLQQPTIATTPKIQSAPKVQEQSPSQPMFGTQVQSDQAASKPMFGGDPSKSTTVITSTFGTQPPGSGPTFGQKPPTQEAPKPLASAPFSAPQTQQTTTHAPSFLNKPAQQNAPFGLQPPQAQIQQNQPSQGVNIFNTGNVSQPGSQVQQPKGLALGGSAPSLTKLREQNAEDQRRKEEALKKQKDDDAWANRQYQPKQHNQQDIQMEEQPEAQVIQMQTFLKSRNDNDPAGKERSRPLAINMNSYNNSLAVNSVANNRMSTVNEVNLSTLLQPQIPTFLSPILADFGNIFESSTNTLNQLTGDQQDRSKRQYMLEIQKIANQYFYRLCELHNSLQDKEQIALVRGMIEVWNFFDAAYLSRNKVEVILKLLRLINYLYIDKSQLYQTLQSKIDRQQNYGSELVQLMVLGDFPTIHTVITKDPHFSQQDSLLNGIAEHVLRLAQMFCQQEIGVEVNMDIFNREQMERLRFNQNYINDVINMHQKSYHQSLLPLARLMTGDKSSIGGFSNHLSQSLMHMLFIPMRQEENVQDVLKDFYVLNPANKSQDFSQQIIELLRFKPLVFLHKLEDLLPPMISFHLHELYTRFNLYPESKQNMHVYNHLANQKIHGYLELLLTSNLGLEKLQIALSYIKGLPYDKQKVQCLKTVIDNSLEIQTVEDLNLITGYIASVFAPETQGNDLIYGYQKSYITRALREKNFPDAFDTILKMDRTDFFTTLTHTYVNNLLQDDVLFNQTLELVYDIRNSLKQIQRDQLILRSNDFEYLLVLVELAEACNRLDSEQIEKCLNDFSSPNRLRIPQIYYKPVLKVLHPAFLNKNVSLKYENMKELSLVLVQNESYLKREMTRDIGEAICNRMVYSFN